jgi:hypothetical protein
MSTFIENISAMSFAEEKTRPDPLQHHDKEVTTKWTALFVQRRVIYMVFFLHGIAQLFSSNAITNSSSFFLKHVSKSNMGFMMMDYLFVVLTTARLLFLIISNCVVSWVNRDDWNVVINLFLLFRKIL